MMNATLRRLSVLATLLSLVTIAPAASADEEKAGAQAAFDLGKKLMLEGRYNEACPKFHESLRIDPGVGTMLFLADCWEKTGRTASAWAQFREAEALASRQQDGREAIARKRGDSLEPKLNRLVIVVPATLTSLKGLRVQRDDVNVGSGLWGVGIPMDPGAHTVVVSATGKKNWSTQVTIDAGSRSEQLKLPEQLEDDPDAVKAPEGAPATDPAKATPSGPADTKDRGKPQKLAGIIAGGAGIVALGLGAGFGLHAMSKDDASKADGHCDANNLCDPVGSKARSDAFGAATTSTVFFTVGVVAVVAGVVLFVTAPKNAPSKTAGLLLGGARATGVRLTF